MPPKQQSKADVAKKQKVVEDKTFGLKNKNKSKNVQKYVQSLKQSVQPKLDPSKLNAQKKKDEEKAREKELNELLKVAVRQPKVPPGVDPKSILCEHFKFGQCAKGFKCKFSHDLNVQRKGEKIDIYSDKRDDQETMEDWDQDTLEKVVASKSEEYNKNKPTDIVCKYFLEAVEKKQYGWFWVCPNGGKECHYRHALPPGYILKSQMKALLEEESEKISIEEEIENQRAKVATTTPMTPELFMQWKKKKTEEKEAGLAAQRAERAKNDRMSGRELFLSDASLFVDDAEAYDKYQREEEPDSDQKEEEVERLQKWKSFLEQHAVSASSAHDLNDDNVRPVVSEDPQVTANKTEPVGAAKKDSSEKRSVPGNQEEVLPTKEVATTQHEKFHEAQTWANISPYLNSVERMMSFRVKKKKNMATETKCMHNDLPSIDEERPSGEESEDDDKEITDNSADVSAVESSATDEMSPGPPFPWEEELEFLVRGGVPKDLRGEVWQALIGVRTRRVESYYHDLVATENDYSDGKEHDGLTSGVIKTQQKGERYDLPEKYKKQIEKDLPRTFPGHPALNDNGRNSLRRVLLAYARHNPSVGYCQAMNFFAGLLLLMMPEENAFWTLMGIIDDYFKGYFSQEMIESQVDQLVFEDLMRERFPKLVNHLDYLGVEVAWISGPWFLSIFINMLPWESVLRVWDVLLFEGNRVMLFRTALALMDLYGPAVVTTKDAGDAITLLQTLTGSTFDSSQLVLTACIGFLTINEDRLEELRDKHRPAVLAAVEERAKGGRVFKDPKGLATKLYSFKHDPQSLVIEKKNEAGSGDKTDASEILNVDSHSANVDAFLKGITVDSEVDSLPDLQEQVVWLKVELCRLLEEKRSAIIRAEELEAALMEMVKEDNRRELSARVEQLEQEVTELRQALADKKEEEKAIVQVLMKVEQEQRITEDARLFAEHEAAAQKYAVHVLQEKYDKAMADLTRMEKRAVMAESMLEATLQYESGQSKALSSPR